MGSASRVILAVFAGVGAMALAAASGLWLLWDSQALLLRRHALLSDLQRSVVTLNLSGLDAIPLFLTPDDAIITPMMTRYGVWEANETYWFCRNLGPGDILVDVGANVGYYTVLGAHIVGETGHVYAFEPDPESFALLERNVRLNGLTNVTLEQKAVSNEPGELRLYLAPENKGDHRIFESENDARESVVVAAVTLDDYFRGREAQVDFVKVDTQGAEGVILDGMARLLAESDGLRLALEFSPWHLSQFGYDPKRLVEKLEAVDFRSYDLGRGVPRVHGLAPLSPSEALGAYPGETDDQFTNLLLVRSGLAFEPDDPRDVAEKGEAFCPIPRSY